MLIKAVFKSCRSEAGRERSYMKMLRQSLKQISPLKMQLESAHRHARTHTHTQRNWRHIVQTLKCDILVKILSCLLLKMLQIKMRLKKVNHTYVDAVILASYAWRFLFFVLVFWWWCWNQNQLLHYMQKSTRMTWLLLNCWKLYLQA